MISNENIWAWVQNLHLLNESKTELQRKNFKGNYKTSSLQKLYVYLFIYMYMYISQLYRKYLLSFPNTVYIISGKTNLIQEPD